MSTLCSLRGERLPGASPPVRCEFHTPKGRCRKMTSHGAQYAWGCVALCEKHMIEECGPEDRK